MPITLSRLVFALSGATLFGCAPRSAPEPVSAPRPMHLVVQENNLLLGGPRVPDVQPVSSRLANAFFAALKDEKVESRYIIGSCEDRAHYISMMLRKHGIASGKVWVVAPARYTLLSRELISVREPLGITESVTWGHHVAPYIAVESNGAVDTLVIDQSFSPGDYLTLDQWFRRLNSPRSIHFFTGVDDYLFNSLDGLTVYGNGEQVQPTPSIKLPSWMPNILTGDFQQYNLQSQGSIISEGMAANDLAMHLFERSSGMRDASERKALLQLLGSEDGISQLVGTAEVAGLTEDTRSAARAFYQSRIRHWSSRLAELSS